MLLSNNFKMPSMAKRRYRMKPNNLTINLILPIDLSMVFLTRTPDGRATSSHTRMIS